MVVYWLAGGPEKIRGYMWSQGREHRYADGSWSSCYPHRGTQELCLSFHNVWLAKWSRILDFVAERNWMGILQCLYRFIWAGGM